MNVPTCCFEVIMQALQDHQWLGRASVAGRLPVPKGWVSHELLVRALQPFSLLQVRLQQQLFSGCRGEVSVHTVRSLEHALEVLQEKSSTSLSSGQS